MPRQQPRAGQLKSVVDIVQTKPASSIDGELVFENDTNCLLMWKGVSWLELFKVPDSFFILLESGDFLLQENSDKLIATSL